MSRKKDRFRYKFVMKISRKMHWKVRKEKSKMTRNDKKKENILKAKSSRNWEDFEDLKIKNHAFLMEDGKEGEKWIISTNLPWLCCSGLANAPMRNSGKSVGRKKRILEEWMRVSFKIDDFRAGTFTKLMNNYWWRMDDISSKIS